MKLNNSLTRALLLTAVAGLFGLVASVQAVPYASGITNNGGTVSFILNESADSVKIIFDGGGAGNTNDLGAVSKGLTNFTMGAHTSYAIHVTKSTPIGWYKISADTNKYNQYWGPSGIAVNKNPSDLGRFGRVYVAESAGGGSSTFGSRTDQQGIYVVNADFTDALGYDDTAQTGGIAFTIGDTGATADGRKSPWRLEIGEDGLLYISDWSTNNGNLYRMNADLTTSEPVFQGNGYLNWNSSVHTTINAAVAKGSLAGNNLQVWAVDGRSPSGSFNRLVRWDINGTPLPYNSAPSALLRTAGVPSVADIASDLDIAPDGKFFLTSFRATGAAGTYVADRVNIRVLATDGLTVLWDSLSNSLAMAQSEDIFANSRSVAVSPDGKKVAISKQDTHVWIMDLTNGIPDISTRTNITAFVNGAGAPYTSGATSAADRRDVAFDAAGNFYSGNQNVEVIVVWAPGGTKTTITKSDGTFQVITPPAIVTAAASGATANEQGPANGQFTLTRVGDTSGSLTVNYTVGGTATPTDDYVALPGSVTFAPGATTTNISVVVSNDTIAELTETVILSISGSVNYVASGGPATVNILDNEPTEVAIRLAQTESRLLEGFAGSKVGFTVTRYGSNAPAITVNLGHVGSAGQGVLYNGPASVNLGASVASANFNITPINNEDYQGTKLATVAVAAGTGYALNATNTATATVVDDEYPPGTVLFSDNFETDTSGLWTTNAIDGWADSHIEFNYDYSQLYVPPAPGGSSTRGARLRVNDLVGSQRNAVSMSPTTLTLPDNYRLKFNMWNNYNGPMLDGGSGSTYHTTAGVGTTPDHANLATSAASDGIWFDVDGDGGSTFAVGDTSAYIGFTLQPDNSGVYSAGTTNNPRATTHPFYAMWGGVTAPAAQLANFPGQTGTSQAGNMGMSWHTVVVSKTTNVVTWVIDGILIATVSSDSVPLGPSVFVGYEDIFPGPSSVPTMSFALIDNLKVETFVSAPIVITSIKLVGGNVEVEFTGPPENLAAAFKLQSSGTAGSGYADDNSAVLTDLGAGSFKATTAVSGGAKFYRIKL